MRIYRTPFDDDSPAAGDLAADAASLREDQRARAEGGPDDDTRTLIVDLWYRLAGIAGVDHVTLSIDHIRGYVFRARGGNLPDLEMLADALDPGYEVRAADGVTWVRIRDRDELPAGLPHPLDALAPPY